MVHDRLLSTLTPELATAIARELDALTNEPMTEEEFKSKCKDSAEEMLEKFTFEENMQIAFVPLIISHIAWSYAFKVLDYCRSNRLDEFKKVSREVNQLRKDYINELKRDLDFRHTQKIFDETDRFMEEVAYDFTIFYFSVNTEIKRHYPNIGHDEMRTNAYLSQLMVKVFNAHNRKMDALVATKLKQESNIRYPLVEKLATLMGKFSGGVQLEDNFHVQTSEKILHKNLSRIDFNMVD